MCFPCRRTTSTVIDIARSLILKSRTTSSLWEKTKFGTPPTRNPSSDRHQIRYTWLHPARSWVPITKQYLDTIRPGVSSPHIREIYTLCSHVYYSFLFFFVRVVLPIFQLLTHSLTILPIAYRQHTSADLWRGSAQGSAFWGLEKYNLIFNPIFCKMES